MRTFILTLSLVLLASPALAASDADRLVETLRTSDGARYDSAKRSLVNASVSVRNDVRRRIAETVVTEQNWQTQAYLAVAEAWFDQPTKSERAYTLRGVDPTVYLLDRKKVPNVGRELRRLALPAGVLFELYLETADRYPFAPREKYPLHIDETKFRELRAAEVSALRHGLLDAIAASGHKVAPYVLTHALDDRSSSIALRRVAAMALGLTSAPEADRTLATVARDKGAPMDLRAGAIAGLGHHKGDVARDTLIQLVSDRANPALLATAITSLGNYATKSARARVGAANADRAAMVLTEILIAGGGTHEQRLVEAIGRSGSPAALAALDGVEGRAAANTRRRLTRALAR